MALTICPDCEREISTLAPHCPQCGRPVEKKQDAARVVQVPPGDICPSCGSVGYPIMRTRGNWRITFILLLCFIIPGILYSIWRRSSRYSVCPQCKLPGMVPLDSPGGNQLFQKFGHSYTPKKGVRAEDTLAYKAGKAWAQIWKK